MNKKRLKRNKHRTMVRRMRGTKKPKTKVPKPKKPVEVKPEVSEAKEIEKE